MELTGIRSLSELQIENRKVFCRVDFNVPLSDGNVADDARIRAALPTIEVLGKAGAHIVLASHLGRPKGAKKPELSLEPVAAHLAGLLDDEVRFTDDCVGDGVEKVVNDLPAGGIAVLENLRFHAAEKAGDRDFAKALAAPFDVYVNDAFGTCHRAHTSMYHIVEHFSEKGAGYLVAKEIEFLGRLLTEPDRPFVAVLGGAKVSDKIDVIRSLVSRCDALLIGGAMAYTLLAAQGVQVGESLVERDKLGLAKKVLEMAKSQATRVVLPVDHLVAESIDSETATTTSGKDIGSGLAGFDIGPQTQSAFESEIRKAKTVFWNGPLGVFEKTPFQAGTFGFAQALAASDAVSVVGGGDSASAVRKAGVVDQISHVSTGGGASLQFVEGKPLPGLEALRAGHSFEGS